MRSLVVALVVVSACSGRGRQLLGAPPDRSATGAQTRVVTGPVTFAPSAEPATRYNEPLQGPPRTSLNDAVIAAIKDAAREVGIRPPVADARLFRACAELAEIVPEDGVVDYSVVAFALQRNGIIEPSPHMLVVWSDAATPEVIVEQLRPRLPELLQEGATARLGIGMARRSDGLHAVVFALQASSVSTAPIPRMIAAGGTLSIDAVIDPRYRGPDVFVTHDDGSIRELELKPGRPNGFVAQLSCKARSGRQQVEIAASDAGGSTVLANFPVWCGTEPPHSLTVASSHDDPPAASTEQAEQRLLASLNSDRMAAGLSPLLWDDRLAAVGRSHSDEMKRTRVVAHVSPTTGSAGDRVRAAKIKAGVVLENVARAYGIKEAHEALMSSPGHRANLMSSAATHIGIGVVFGNEVSGRNEMFITQVFTRVPPKIDPASAVATVFRKLAAQRPVTSAPRLTVLAQPFADALAAGRPREKAYDEIRARLEGLGKFYVRVETAISATADLDALDGAAMLEGSMTDEVGIGVAQGPHPELGDNTIWVVLLLAQRR
jgi:uncharacterized protein YkwD